jgi:ABC-2 type transport system ATP-binding protein
MDTVIKIENAEKRFGKKEVLKGVSLDVPAGSVVGLLGKNGAGKTTLMKCALGLLKLQAGRITVLGENAWDLSEQAKARIGYVAQQSMFYYWMKVGDVVDYTASFYPDWDVAMVQKMVKDWELNLKDSAMRLSEGQKQRLAIVLALGHRPDLLVLDEPVASLDPVGRRQFLKTILEAVADKECTVLFSSHITSDLERIADRVAILNDGKVIFTGETDGLKDSVKLLKVTCNGSRPAQWDAPGVLRVKSVDDRAFVYINDYSDELRRELEPRWNASIEVADLNLEDIFVEMTQ